MKKKQQQKKITVWEWKATHGDELDSMKDRERMWMRASERDEKNIVKH
jgi:hypothetical protein